jgi:hypothetical protein
MSQLTTEEQQVDVEHFETSSCKSTASLEEMPTPQNVAAELTTPIKMAHFLDHGSYTCSENAEMQNSQTVRTPGQHSGGVKDLSEPDPFMGVSQEYVKTNSFLESFNSVQMETSAEQDATESGDAALESGSFAKVDMQEEILIPLDEPDAQSDSDASVVDESFTETTLGQKAQQAQDSNNVINFESDGQLHQLDNHNELDKQGLNNKQRKTLICMVEQFKQNKSSFIVSKLPNRATNQHYYKVLKR